jgi:hypothetical protein
MAYEIGNEVRVAQSRRSIGAAHRLEAYISQCSVGTDGGGDPRLSKGRAPARSGVECQINSETARSDCVCCYHAS